MNDLNDRLQKTSIFVGKFILAGLIFQLILHINPSTYQVQAAFASFMTSILNIIGLEAVNTGIRIFTDNSIYVIVQDCLGWKSLAVFLGLMYASTKRTLEHLNFILIGLLTLILANIARISSTIYLAELNIVQFDIIHGVLWRWSLTLVVLGLWIYWFKNFQNRIKFDKKIEAHVQDLKSK